jgi:hypothetical protein
MEPRSRKQVDRDRRPKRLDRDVSADRPKSVHERAALLIAQSDVAEQFDDAARERVGQRIAAARLKSAKSKQKRPR